MARLKASVQKALDEEPQLKAAVRGLTASLVKHGVDADELNLEVCLTLDRSGSTEGRHWQRFYYTRGIMQEAVRRIIPVAVRVDGNATLDGTMFSNEAVDVGEVKITDPGWQDIVNTWVHKFQAEASRDLGGTNLLSALLLNLDRYARKYAVNSTHPDVVAMGGGWMEVPDGWMDTWTDSSGGERGGFGFRRRRGSERVLPRLVKPALVPLLNFTFCDGDVNEDTQHLVVEFLQATCFLPYFESLVGLGDDRFKFFSDLDDELKTAVDHVNFAKIPDIHRITDEKLYDEVVLGELAIPTRDNPHQPPWLAVAGGQVAAADRRVYNIIVPTALPVR